ncbi:hypothetical protein BKK79_36940 (plasmid) [Cupriavidus sp. USMAA2-4]|uniref:YbjN domain-containing protein n=1 Tax=Cupriavidus sp. USMAA2-4 TaxID=876364 RepID=UPI0008A6823E|nr:YbjN domain-containing protein [Cupriavidus sp. USMAA2-4]AOY97531.1 hypothetical protein BKK79_36940 [Cupriavidus sp. USMAA2-4]
MNHESAPGYDGRNHRAEREILAAIDADGLAEAIRAAGCAVTRIEGTGAPLHSACHGVGFEVLWGNAADDGGYVDFTLACTLRVSGGEVPRVLADGWHRSRRFARVATHGDRLALEMDVVLHGGVTRAHLMAMLQLWMRMTGEFLLHLRGTAAVGQAGGAAEAEEAARAAQAASAA